MLAFVVGGLLTTFAIVRLEPGPQKSYIVALGFSIVVFGCIIGLVTARRAAATHAEEVAMLRLELAVAKTDADARQARLEEVEAEMSMHSRALARLLDR
jgi:hypothetical protein